MVINLGNFFNTKNKNSKISDFQDLDHLDGLAISVVNAKLYNPPRDDLVLFYFRNGANFASLYTQSTIISENIKWNKQINSKKIKNSNIFKKRTLEEIKLQLETLSKLKDDGKIRAIGLSNETCWGAMQYIDIS